MITLEDRMMDYEKTNKQVLTKRLPIIVRLDGEKFSKFTKNFEKPFDSKLGDIMKETALAVAEKYSECVFFTTHSDEISFFFNTYQTLNSTGVYGQNKSKIESKLASKVTLEFTKQLMIKGLSNLLDEFEGFDARAFVLPKEEVVNYFFSRQLSSRRNSVQMYAREFYSQKEISGYSNAELLTKLATEHDFTWEDKALWKKNGYMGMKIFKEDGTLSNKWEVSEAELFKHENRKILDVYVDYMRLD